MGKFLALVILAAALIGGGAMYYLQVYAYYDEIAAAGPDDVQAVTVAGQPEPLPHDAFRAIDSDSSPIRYRACFTTSLSPQDLRDRYQDYPRAVPLLAPKWFDCFDARELGAALEDGTAQAVMGTENIRYGIDRVVAVMPDGRGFVWHQINRCGEVVFDGQPAPADCPPPPQGN